VAFDTAGRQRYCPRRRGASVRRCHPFAADAPAARAAAQRPSPLYTWARPDAAYESRAAKFELLQNVLLLPPFLERAIFFGALACWTPGCTRLRAADPLLLALNVLIKWWLY